MTTENIEQIVRLLKQYQSQYVEDFPTQELGEHIISLYDGLSLDDRYSLIMAWEQKEEATVVKEQGFDGLSQEEIIEQYFAGGITQDRLKSMGELSKSFLEALDQIGTTDHEDETKPSTPPSASPKPTNWLSENP